MRALVAGFQGDMIVAGHLVPPQLEAMVRHVVESQGATTSKLEPGSIQPERSLGPLLETPEALLPSVKTVCLNCRTCSLSS